MPDPFDTDPAVYEKLLAQVLLGNDHAARRLADALTPIIRKVVMRRVPRDLRDDLIQEVWNHLWSRNCRVLQQWGRKGPLLHYVAVVTSNLVGDILARRNIDVTSIDDYPDPPDPANPGQALEAKQLAECIENAKSRLSETYRKMIHLRHELGLQHQEIAVEFGKTIGYVGATLARAERYLRDEIMETCSDHLGGFQMIFRG